MSDNPRPRLPAKPPFLSPLTIRQIRRWAELHRRRTGRWPTRTSGMVLDAPGERWDRVLQALSKGLRHLPPKTTLRQILK